MNEPIVTIAQMQAIENRMFAAGMPIAALMEKVGGRITGRIQQLFPLMDYPRVGVVFGSGHNGGDALVVARELYWLGYEVLVYGPIDRLKDLTDQHYRYVTSLGIARVSSIAELASCDVIVDGLFGFGLDRMLSPAFINTIVEINSLRLPIVSIDLPSGIHADSGNVLGAALQSSHTLCLGLWKLAFAQNAALLYLGRTELISFDIPPSDIQAVLGTYSPIEMMTQESADRYLPHQRPQITHKYQQGHLLLIVGSLQYAGAAILAGLGARASGVGLLSIAVPHSLKLAVIQALPDAIVIGCPETPQGAIAHLPDHFNPSKYTAVAVGCGLTTEPIALIEFVLDWDVPLILDADALNILATFPTDRWIHRCATTILTPHEGEWQRLFPTESHLAESINRLMNTTERAAQTNTILLRKGARTVISNGLKTWVINNGTPALARGGSGDVLTGLIGGLIATAQAQPADLIDIVASGNWWHAQAGSTSAQARGLSGVDAITLTQYLTSTIAPS